MACHSRLQAHLWDSAHTQSPLSLLTLSARSQCSHSVPTPSAHSQCLRSLHLVLTLIVYLYMEFGHTRFECMCVFLLTCLAFLYTFFFHLQVLFFASLPLGCFLAPGVTVKNATLQGFYCLSHFELLILCRYVMHVAPFILLSPGVGKCSFLWGMKVNENPWCWF